MFFSLAHNFSCG